jgi:catechol 2,3-dioxygenase-like lactoylglutathione lyase family enzyme
MKFKIKSAIYFCKNMAAMANFYTGIMGLRVIKNNHHPPDEWIELAVPHSNPGFPR